MSEQAQDDRAALLRRAARDARVYAGDRERAKALDMLAVEWPLLEAVVAATRALTRWARGHSCGDCELAGLCDVCNDADNALHKLDAHRAGSAKAAGEEG